MSARSRGAIRNAPGADEQRQAALRTKGRDEPARQDAALHSFPAAGLGGGHGAHGARDAGRCPLRRGRTHRREPGGRHHAQKKHARPPPAARERLILRPARRRASPWDPFPGTSQTRAVTKPELQRTAFLPSQQRLPVPIKTVGNGTFNGCVTQRHGSESCSLTAGSLRLCATPGATQTSVPGGHLSPCSADGRAPRSARSPVDWNTPPLHWQYRCAKASIIRSIFWASPGSRKLHRNCLWEREGVRHRAGGTAYSAR